MSKLSDALGAMDKATPGPWEWFANTQTKEVYLATPDRGRTFVMDFVRYGMRLAAPRFQVRDESGNGIMHRVDELSKPNYNGAIEITHPDALQIKAAPDMAAWIKEALPWLEEMRKFNKTMLESEFVSKKHKREIVKPELARLDALIARAKPEEVGHA